MGYIAHHAIVVTGSDQGGIMQAAAKAKELGMTVVGPSDHVVNMYRSFLVCPDGSKEGWDESNRGDAARRAFVTWLTEPSERYLHWVEVRFGGDDPDMAKVLRHSGDEE